jgi:hypothetical protein
MSAPGKEHKQKMLKYFREERSLWTEGYEEAAIYVRGNKRVGLKGG